MVNNLISIGSESHSNSNFHFPLLHGISHYPVYACCSKQQRNTCKKTNENHAEASGSQGRLNELFHGFYARNCNITIDRNDLATDCFSNHPGFSHCSNYEHHPSDKETNRPLINLSYRRI